MPTGYTADIVEKDVTFNEFVWTCARAFGALIHMRDEPLDATIHKDDSNRKYHYDELNRIRKEWQKFSAMSQQRKVVERDFEHAQNLKEHEEAVARAKVVRERLEEMLATVTNWYPPTKDHQGLKDFMIQQLRETITYDGTYDRSAPKKPSIEAWIKTKEDCFRSDVDYHTEKIHKESDADRKVDEWIDQLQNSVPYPKGKIK